MMTDILNKSMFIQPRNTPESAWTGHIPFAAWLIEATQPNVLVELGTHRGASFLAFCQAIQACGAPTKCYAVDTWQGDQHAGKYDEDVFRTLSDFHNRYYADFSRLMRMTFNEAAEYFENGSIDILHIDGLHTYDAVKNDLETWLPKLSSNAVVLFHDINVRERDFGVWRYWSQIKNSYPHFEFTHTHGLGVLAVGTNCPQAVAELCQRSESATDTALINRLFDHLGRVITTTCDVRDLAEQLGHQSSVIVQGEAEREALASQLGDAERQIVALASESERLNSIERENQRLKTIEHAADEMSLHADQLEAALEQARAEMMIMRNSFETSFSWRITTPLRATKRFFS